MGDEQLRAAFSHWDVCYADGLLTSVELRTQCEQHLYRREDHKGRCPTAQQEAGLWRGWWVGVVHNFLTNLYRVYNTRSLCTVHVHECRVHVSAEPRVSYKLELAFKSPVCPVQWRGDSCGLHWYSGRDTKGHRRTADRRSVLKFPQNTSTQLPLHGAIVEIFRIKFILKRRGCV